MKKPAPAPVETKSEAFDPIAVAAKFKKWFPDLPAATVANLVVYQTELLKFNKTINLISSNTTKNAESVHVADSVLASRIIAPALIPGEPLYDIGSGNGCPGVIFALMFPKQSVILVDRDHRKLEFCKHAAAAMGVKNMSVMLKGIEEIPAGSIKSAVARGFAPFSKALLLCRKHFVKDGKFFHMKSDGWANEMAKMPSQVFSHWKPSVLGQYRLPETTTDMFVVLTEKTAD